MPAGMTGRQITIDGLLGGHSGMDIEKGRAGAHQLMARLLVNAPAGCGVRLARLTGGDMLNVIPRATTVVVAIPAGKTGVFNTYVNDFKAAVANELATTDPGFAVTVAPAGLPAKVMETGAQQALINAVYAAPQGVYRMSADVPGLVETSNNIGVLSIGNGQFAAGANVRSAIDSERDAEAQRFVRVFQSAGVTVTLYGAYSSWPPNPNSPLLALVKQVYENLYFVAPTVAAVHAGLETSVAGVKYPGMDMISIGPTIRNVHSPDERLEAATVSKVYDLIVATLGKIQ
jgi:dipeptidase D